MDLLNVYKEDEPEKSYCLFLDILGFTNDIIANDKMQRHKEHLKELRKSIKSSIVKFEDNSCHTLKVFTDNIVIGVPLKRLTRAMSMFDGIEDFEEEELNEYAGYASGDAVSELYEHHFNDIITPVVYYQLNMVLNSFFVRGGWDCGILYMDDIIVYGKSLIDAYELEMKSDYPRILLCDKIKEMIDRQIYNKEVLQPFAHHRYFEIYGNATNQYVLKDEKDNYFINYLYGVITDSRVDYEKLNKHKIIVEERILRYKCNGKILRKYCWSAFYHNRFCELFLRDKLKIKDINEFLIKDIPWHENWKIEWIILDKSNY